MPLASQIQPASGSRRLGLSSVSPYLAALLLVAAALLIRLMLQPVVGNGSPFLLFAVAVLAAASYGGWRPGLLATVTSALTGLYFFVEPRYSLRLDGKSAAIQLGSFILLGICTTIFADRLRAARRSAEDISARNAENLDAANACTFDWNIATGEVRCSENMEALHGLKPGSFERTMEGLIKLIHPDDHEKVRLNINRALESTGTYHMECRHVRTDGSFLWMDASGRVVYEARTRRPLRMMGICVDATERKRNEEARLQLAAIVDSSEDAILSVDLNGVILTWNAAAERIFGYTPAEAIGQSITLIVPPGFEDEEAEIMGRLQRGEPLHHFETLRVAKGGRQIWVSLTISPIRNTSGATVAASGVVRDITENKALEENLRQTAKLESLGVLAGGIAHDFNNLLVGILGNASMVKDNLPPRSPAHPMLDDVISAGQRASILIQQLLAYSGKGKFVIRPLDLSSLVREMVSLIQTSIPGTVRLQLNLATGLPPVTADVAQMQQLVMNLAINAAEAIVDKPGVVTITTDVQDIDERSSNGIAPGKYVSLEVRDTGTGMDEATRAKIFDPFFTTKFTGRGLGLSATLGIVRGHKGSIRVDSQPGQGSTFRILLPAGRGKALAGSATAG